MNSDRFVELLRKLISVSESLQNDPPRLVPIENNASDHVIEALKHVSGDGQPLTVRRVEYVGGRGNLIVTYPSKSGSKKSISFIGSHLDVVPARPEDWERNPFALVVEGDKLYGRGTTDCLGHVALLTEFMLHLAETKPELESTIVVVFISDEENGSARAGIEMLLEHGELEICKNGPVFWMDSADSQPCIGTAAAQQWALVAHGKDGHSGLPHNSVNPVELGMDAISKIQESFYDNFPPHDKEKEYNFLTPSTLKPTRFTVPAGSVNQILSNATVEGDVRLTPFYNLDDVKAKMEETVKGLNDNMETLHAHSRGPVSRYVAGPHRGNIEWKWTGDAYDGIACDIQSPGFEALRNATLKVKGECKPYSICGSLPLVGMLQKSGLDIQICGYGRSAVYHGINEYCTLEEMQHGFAIVQDIVSALGKK